MGVWTFACAEQLVGLEDALLNATCVERPKKRKSGEEVWLLMQGHYGTGMWNFGLLGGEPINVLQPAKASQRSKIGCKKLPEQDKRVADKYIPRKVAHAQSDMQHKYGHLCLRVT